MSLCLLLVLAGCAAKKSVEGGAADGDGGGGILRIGLPF
jgi:hypothetical protein